MDFADKFIEQEKILEPLANMTELIAQKRHAYIMSQSRYITRR
jgi:hypothetical protein